MCFCGNYGSLFPHRAINQLTPLQMSPRGAVSPFKEEVTQSVFHPEGPVERNLICSQLLIENVICVSHVISLTGAAVQNKVVGVGRTELESLVCFMQS